MIQLKPEIVILAAGLGERFAREGILIPKQLFSLQQDAVSKNDRLLTAIVNSIEAGTGIKPSIVVRKGGDLEHLLRTFGLEDRFSTIHRVPVLTPESSSPLFSAMFALQQSGTRPALLVDSDSWFPPEVYQEALCSLERTAELSMSPTWTCSVCDVSGTARTSWFRLDSRGVAVGLYGVTSAQSISEAYRQWHQTYPMPTEPSIPDSLEFFLGHPLGSVPIVPQSKWLSVGTPEELNRVTAIMQTRGMTKSRLEARERKWVGVDLDSTLVQDDPDARRPGHIGPFFDALEGADQQCLVSVVDKVKQLLAEGIEVRIFTARVSNPAPLESAYERMCISEWSYRTFGVALKVTHEKDLGCSLIIDDRSVAPVDGHVPTNFSC